jgi:hypothetical protein
MRLLVSARAQDPGVRWLGIASGLWVTSADLRHYQKQFAIRIPLVLDASGDLFRAFNVMQIPAALVADPAGRIVRRLEFKDLESPAALLTATQ